MNPFVLAPLSLTTAWIVLGAAAVRFATSRLERRVSVETLPPITVLKPLCGADPSLRENLESFFCQRYPRFEIVFGLERADDPALPVVEELVRAHPEVSAKIVVHGRKRGHNPKVRNLRGMIGRASYDLVLVSDSNVRVPVDYLESMATELLRDPDVGLVTSVFAGRGEKTLGGALECVALNGYCAAGASLPTMVGYAAVIGKSMLFSKRDLAAVGGLGRVADVLAEDFVLGKLFERAGRRVAISRTVIDNVVGDLPTRAFVDRHLRWSMLRFRLRPLAFALEPVTSPLAMLPLAYHAMGPWALVWALALLAVRDAGGWLSLRGRAGLATPIALSLVREIVALGIWMVTPLKRHVSWRGHRLRVATGTVLVADGSR